MRMVEAIDVENQSETLKSACHGAFKNAVSHELGKHAAHVIDMTMEQKNVWQKDLARELDVAEPTLTAWRHGHISMAELVRLIHHARTLAVDVPSYSDIFDEVEEVAARAATIKGMETLRGFVNEPIAIQLTERMYECVRRAAQCDELWKARERGCDEAVNRISTELFPGCSTACFLATVDEWCPHSWLS